MNDQNKDNLPVGVPDGYALVPVQPTRDMLLAAGGHVTVDRYQVMLAAAPTVKAEQVPVAAIRKLLSNWDDLKPGDSENVDAVRNWLDAAPSLPAAGSWLDQWQGAYAKNCVMELLETTVAVLESAEERQTADELRALLASAGRGEA